MKEMLEDIQQQILLEACSPNAKALRILNINKNIIASLNNPNKEDIIRITTILERARYMLSIPYFISSNCILSYLFKSFIKFIERFTTKFLIIFSITNYIIIINKL